MTTLKIKIAWIGKTKAPAIQTLTDEYLKRLKHYAEVEGVSLKDEAALLKLCEPGARPVRFALVLLDSRGKQLSSEEFAKWLGEFQGRNSSPLLFAIGAADGFSEEARRSATLVLSLGKMTLAHELARVVLLEQIYRAFTIQKGHPYHLGH
ncbi:MAG: 23S rRNA (pseudouridine(1915)-N(3))-methyltransferase RlmH [Terriglobales bacterium]